MAISPAPPKAMEESVADAVGPPEGKASMPQGETETHEIQMPASPDAAVCKATRLPVLLGATNLDHVPEQ